MKVPPADSHRAAVLGGELILMLRPKEALPLPWWDQVRVFNLLQQLLRGPEHPLPVRDQHRLCGRDSAFTLLQAE